MKNNLNRRDMLKGGAVGAMGALIPMSIVPNSHKDINVNKSTVFNKQPDVEILKGIADGLYNKIDNLHSIMRNG